MYLFRLDDACEYMDLVKWNRVEQLFEKYGILPLVGIIPKCEDPILKATYEYSELFWFKAKNWVRKGWTIAMHGYEHLYKTNEKGIIPINSYSEFAGVSLELQKKTISCGYNILLQHNLVVNIFFAPAHTFDLNTLEALKQETPINTISDGIAYDVFFKDDFYFVPVQAGQVRHLPFAITTFCYHPNTMNDSDFKKLEQFIIQNRANCGNFNIVNLKTRKINILDQLLSKMYFAKKSINFH